MSGCEVKRGFFSLRECPEPVASRCPVCKRAICRAHRAEGNAVGLCLDCQAREDHKARRSRAAKPATRNAVPEVSYSNDSGNEYNERAVADRRERLTAAGYTPVFYSSYSHGSGHSHNHGFDSHDSQSFEQLAVERDDDDHPGGSLGDS